MTESKFRGLASELLANIFSSLSRRDLVHVVRVCKSFNLSGCLLLYQHVDLRSDDPYVGYTLDLLRNHESIEKKIVCASFTTMRPRYAHHRSWIDAEILARWTNLRSLELRGYPFTDRRESDVFIHTLHVSCQQLRCFTYKPCFGALPDNFDLIGLKDVTWLGGPDTEDMPIIPTMSTSRHTITRISFMGTISYKRDKSFDTLLQHLRFPSLQSLELGSLISTDDAVRTNTAITRFILAHPRITHLSLGRTRSPIDDDNTNGSFFQFDRNLLRRESFPSLKTFEGFLENVTMLASLSVYSLFSITSLSLYCPDKDAKLMEKFEEMCEAVTHANGTYKKFPFVTYLRCEFLAELHHLMPLDTTSLTHRTCMDHLSQLCPSVVSWYGCLPPMTSDHLTSMFSMYDNLETLSLPRSSLFLHIGSSELMYFRRIADRCPKLKKVVARKPQYTEVENHVFILNRDFDGNLFSVTVLATPDDPTL